MPDPRFYEEMGPVTASELAALCGAAAPEPDSGRRLIAQAAPLNKADETSVGYFGDRRYAQDLGATRAGACFVTSAFAASLPQGCLALVTPEPQAADRKSVV